MRKILLNKKNMLDLLLVQIYIQQLLINPNSSKNEQLSKYELILKLKNNVI